MPYSSDYSPSDRRVPVICPPPAGVQLAIRGEEWPMVDDSRQRRRRYRRHYLDERGCEPEEATGKPPSLDLERIDPHHLTELNCCV